MHFDGRPEDSDKYFARGLDVKKTLWYTTPPPVTESAMHAPVGLPEWGRGRFFDK